MARTHSASSPLTIQRSACIRTLAYSAPLLGGESVSFHPSASGQLIFEQQYLAGGICFPGYRQLFTFLRIAAGFGITQWQYSEEIPFTVSLQV
jgi:hypothetical protein